jgi:hypothetical protein
MQVQKPLTDFFSAQDETAEEFLGNARVALKGLKEPIEMYSQILALCISFAEAFAEVVPPLQEWSALVSSAEEEYMPGGPPMSPVTDSLFNYWMVTELRFGPGPETLLESVQALLGAAKPKKSDQKILNILHSLANSRLSIYEVTHKQRGRLTLEEIVTGETVACQCLSGYPGKVGELWLVRLLPGLKPEEPHITATTPYILRGCTRQTWVDQTEQEAARAGISVDQLFRYGHLGFSWLEFVFQGYSGQLAGAIYLTGQLQDPFTRPHSDGRDLRPSYSAAPVDPPDFEFNLTNGQRKLVAQCFPDLEPKLGLGKKTRQDVSLDPQQVLKLKRFILEEALPGAMGSELTVARSLDEELDDAFRAVAQMVEKALKDDDDLEKSDLLIRFILEDVVEEVVRWVKVPAKYDLLDLHQIIQIVFGWENCHLHRFEFDGVSFGPGEGDDEEEDYGLDEAFQSCQTAFYQYDFGDGWQVRLDLLRRYEWSDGVPLLVATRGPNLVEDCGGPPMFDDLLQVVRNPKLEDERGMRDFVGEDYDPWGVTEPAIQESLAASFGQEWGSGCREMPVFRHQVEAFEVNGKPADLVIAFETQEEEILFAEPCLRTDDDRLVGEAVRQGLLKLFYPEAVVVQDKKLIPVIKGATDLPVKVEKPIYRAREIGEEIEAKMAGRYIAIDHLPHQTLSDFIELANQYYLNPPWLGVDDDALMIIRGLTPHPLTLSVLGSEGVELGLAVFEDVDEAIRIFTDQPRGSGDLFFLTYLERWEGTLLKRDLAARGLPTLSDATPVVLAGKGHAGIREYQLMVDILQLVRLFKFKKRKKQTITLDERGEVELTWPVFPDELEKYRRSKAEQPRKLGRNDPCWCGSGKKYKKCHLGRD